LCDPALVLYALLRPKSRHEGALSDRDVRRCISAASLFPAPAQGRDTGVGEVVDLKEADLLGQDIDRHWYYRAKFAALRRLLGKVPARRVIDVGAGVGFFSRELLRHTGIASAICVDPGYAADHEEDVGGKTLQFRRTIGATEADLVLMMDVLEHVDDDAGLVGEYAAKVPAGTHFVVTVPAFQWLWSGHDVFLEHRRRYTLAGIETALRRGGLRVQHGCYFYGLLFPAAAGSRLLERLRRGPGDRPQSQMQSFGPFLNAAFLAACRTELPLFQANRLAGLTAFVHAVKP
jgi:hypothetical protein